MEAALTAFNDACVANTSLPQCEAAEQLSPYRFIAKFTVVPCKPVGRQPSMDSVVVGASYPMAEPGTLVLVGGPTLIVRAQYQPLTGKWLAVAGRLVEAAAA